MEKPSALGGEHRTRILACREENVVPGMVGTRSGGRPPGRHPEYRQMASAAYRCHHGRAGNTGACGIFYIRRSACARKAFACRIHGARWDADLERGRYANGGAVRGVPREDNNLRLWE